MARTPEYQLGNALINPEAAGAVREIFDRPELPPPPTEDHPMVQFAQRMLSPMRLPTTPLNEVGQFLADSAGDTASRIGSFANQALDLTPIPWAGRAENIRKDL